MDNVFSNATINLGSNKEMMVGWNENKSHDKTPTYTTNAYDCSTNGAYCLFKRTKNLEVTSTSLTSGNTYTYKVRSYVVLNDVKVYAPDSNEVSFVAE